MNETEMQKILQEEDFDSSVELEVRDNLGEWIITWGILIFSN